MRDVRAELQPNDSPTEPGPVFTAVLFIFKQSQAKSYLLLSSFGLCPLLSKLRENQTIKEACMDALLFSWTNRVLVLVGY